MTTTPSIRINVLGDDTIGPEALIYAEDRLGAALAELTDGEVVRHAGVILRRAKPYASSPRVTCIVNVGVGGASVLSIRTAADHPYAAVNRAVERLRSECAPGMERAVPSGRS